MRTLSRVPVVALCLILSATTVALAAHKSAPKPVRVIKHSAIGRHAATTPGKTAPVTPAKPLLATVDGSPISQANWDSAIKERWAAQIMRSLIEDRLIRREAKRLGVKATPQEVQQAFDTERHKYPNDHAFQRHLHEIGISPAAFLDGLTRHILLQKLMQRQEAVSDSDVAAYYNAHKAEFTTPAKVHLFAIVTASIEDAYLAKERLMDGTLFATVAKDLSIDPSKDKGGDMGWVEAKDLPDKELATTIFALQPEAVSNPIRSGNNYYIVNVKEKQAGKVVSEAKAAPEIRKKLEAEKGLTQQEYIDLLARRANIVVNWEPVRYLTAEYGRLHSIQVIVDGKPLDLEQPPVRLANGDLIVPAKPVLQAIGAQLSWSAPKQSLTATTTAGRVVMTVGSTKAQAGEGGKTLKDMKSAPEMRQGALFIAPRVALRALGATILWDGELNALRVTSPQAAMPSPTTGPTHGGLEKQP